MTSHEIDMAVRELATQFVERAEADPIVQLAIMHAATMVVAARAIESDDPAQMIEELAGDIHSGATLMVDLIDAAKITANGLHPANADTFPQEHA